MLFENRKQISAEDLMLKYATKEDYNKVMKAPSFEVASHLKKIDHVNGGRVKAPKASMMRSHFIATDPHTKLKVEIRYAQSSNARIVGDRVVDSFEPRYVENKGAAFAFQKDPDLGVYNFLHPNNTLSPLRDPNNKTKGKFEFVDSKKRSAVKMTGINELSKALAHAEGLDYDRLIILAKGLGIKGLDKKEPEDIKVDVMDYAIKNPVVYNQKANSEVTFIEGRIYDLIDKGAIKINTVGNVRRWSWNMGAKEGEHILDVTNSTQDAKVALKNFIFNDINVYKGLLEDLNDELIATAKLQRQLEREGELSAVPNTNPAYQAPKVIGDALPAHLRENTDVEEAYMLPTSKQEAMDMLSEFRPDGKKATWPHANQLLEAVEAREVTEATVRKWIRNNIGY